MADVVQFKNVNNSGGSVSGSDSESVVEEKVDFDKFSQMAADMGAKLIEELSASWGKRQIMKMTVYFALDTGNLEQGLFIHHLRDVYVLM